MPDGNNGYPLANPCDVKSSAKPARHSCCSSSCCSSGGCGEARPAATDVPLPAGTPVLLEETWDIVAAAAPQQQQQQKQQILAVVRVAGISFGNVRGIELLKGGEDPRRFLLLDTA